MMIRMMIQMTTSMIIGENTHHQEILMTPKSFRMRRVVKITPKSPIPELELLAIMCIILQVNKFLS
jgi:hypothetical protein